MQHCRRVILHYIFIYLYCPRNPDDTQKVRWEGYIKFDITSYVLYLSCQLSIDPGFT